MRQSRQAGFCGRSVAWAVKLLAFLIFTKARPISYARRIMIKLGTPMTAPNGVTGTVERNSRRNGVHLVRINDAWFIRAECVKG